jgi:prepilin-type N-terminal cleavage/methylation domain-containing protein/prepilin-type processing-associated H-X9-DG protein
MTLIELLVVIAVLGILVAFILPRMARAPLPMRINCINNLKQIGLATRVWEGDNNDRFPTQVPATNGGSMEFSTGPYMFHHLQVMSNELSTPKVVFCPQESDRNRFLATNFQAFNNSNTSFFFGVDATEKIPGSFLVGDRNLTNGLPLKDAVMELTTNQSPRWTKELHQTYGNIGMADGSVQAVYLTNLQALVVASGLTTNRLQMPILTP